MSTNNGLSPQTDNILQLVSKNFISLQDEEKKSNMVHYMLVLETLIILMKDNDKLFKAIYQRIYGAGSYYDGLKVAKAEEYDVDVIMKLPIDYKEVKFINKKVSPPFTQVEAKVMETLKHHPEWTSTYRFMDCWTDSNGFLLQAPFREWMESVVNKALNVLPKENGASKLIVDRQTYLIKLTKTGPAMTLNITLPNKTKIDVDFVPVIEFKFPDQWPAHPVRRNNVPSRGSWFIVPKPNSKRTEEYVDTYWRLAFHDQEREMINDKGRLKPICRLLKKLRNENTALNSIASYYIKTIFLWDILAKKNDVNYWSRISLSSHFMDMLKLLHKRVVSGSIPYFWDDRYNLIGGMSEVERFNCEKRLERIIKEIETKSLGDPKIIAKHLLAADEFTKLTQLLSTTEAPRSPPVKVVQEKRISTTQQAENGPSLAAIMEILKSMQQELAQQKKMTQTLFVKINNLQQSVDQLTDDNALLRDELKLSKQHSKDLVKRSKNEIGVLDLINFDSANENSCLVVPFSADNDNVLGPSALPFH